MSRLTPEQAIEAQVRYASWGAFVFAVLLILAAADPGQDEIGQAAKLLMTVGWLAFVALQSRALLGNTAVPPRIRWALLAVDSWAFIMLVVSLWVEPATWLRVLMYFAAGLLVVAGFLLWRFRKEMGMTVPVNTRVSIPDEQLYSGHAQRDHPT